MTKFISRFAKDESGATAIEYGLILALVFLAMIVGVTNFGAAAIRQRRCGGCQLELNAVDVARIKAAPADEVLRCEECSRILVRTPDSGLPG